MGTRVGGSKKAAPAATDTPLILGVTKKGERIAEDEAAALSYVDADGHEVVIIPNRRPPRIKPLVLQLYILSKERGVVRLKDTINHAQMAFLDDCEEQLRTRGQIRSCVLKARQIGISTIIEGVSFALSMIHESFSTLIVSHESDSTENILAMNRRYWETYIFRDLASDEKYASASQLAWLNGSAIKVATAKNVGAGRSRTIHFLHASEVAFWSDPSTLMTGLRQSIPSMGLTCIFLESTANGIGNYFWKQCNRAMQGVGEFKFHFYPWHEHPEYTAKFVPDSDRDKYHLDVLDEEEQTLRDKFGVDDARLIWRRYAITNLCEGDLHRFHQEYPTTPHEAFVSTGRNVFPLQGLLDHYEPLVGKRGKLINVNGKVSFTPHPDGWLTLFSEPSDDKDWGIYLGGGDPTHTTVGDYACVQVLNRRTLEQVAVYRRKIDPVNFGRDMQLVGRFFNTALLAPEKTGPGYATIGCLVADGYENLYQTQKIDKLQGAAVDNYGWVTNQQTKHLAISHLLKAVTDGRVQYGGQNYGLLIHDEQTFMEMRDYVVKEGGDGYENGDGSDHDDTVMALGIAMTVHNIEPKPPAYAMDEAPKPRPSGPVTPGLKRGTRRSIDAQPKDTRIATPAPDYKGVELHDEVQLPDLPPDHEPLADGPEGDAPEPPAAPWETWND